jgi:hypothetical protein
MSLRDLAKPAALVGVMASLAVPAMAYADWRVLTMSACGILVVGFLLFRRRRDLAILPPTSLELSASQGGGVGVFSGTLFVLLVSGPPKLRVRDPLASIRGEIDVVVMFQVLVWGLAGLWVAYVLIYGYPLGSRHRLRLWLPQRLGLLLVLCLGISVLKSPAPALTSFKVCQMLIALLFGSLFVERYGVEVCLRKLFLGYTILCVVIATSFFVAPEVLLHTTRHWEVFRLRGDLIAPTGTVSVFAIILLLTICPAVSRLTFLALFGLFGTLLVLSQTRAAYVAVLAFIALAALRRPKTAAVRGFVVTALASVPILMVTGLMPGVVEWVVRDSKSIATLSDRLGLWAYLADVMLRESPWTGLGYFAAGRIYGLKYHANLGEAHSAFAEVFVGGGILSLAVLVLLWFILFVYAAHILLRTNDRISFAASSLLVSVFLLTVVGWGELSAGPAGMTFWCLAAILPACRNQLLVPKRERT